MSRTYWRSLAQIEDRPEFRAALENEFLEEGPSELPEGITRRDMMMLLGASLSLAGLTGCRRPVEERVTASTESTRGSARHSNKAPAPTIPVAPKSTTFITVPFCGRPMIFGAPGV